MDPICHTLTGAALAGVGLRRKTPLAGTALVLAANAPDVDVFVYAVADEYAALAFRRGITHGLPALVVLPLVVAGVVLAWDRHVRRRRAPGAAPARAGPLVVLSLLGVATHPLLDWLNTYGMRWLLPFAGGWSYGDAVFIVDPWLWLALGAAAFLSRRWRRPGLGGWILLALLAAAPVLTVSMIPWGARVLWAAGLVVAAASYAVGWPRTDAGRAGAARAITAAAGLYIVLMVLSTRAAEREVLAAAWAAGIRDVREVMAGPVPATPFEREVVVATSGSYRFGRFRWGTRPRVTLAPDSLPRRASSVPPEVAEAALATDDARDYLVWARLPYVEGGPAGDGWWVRIGDARYPEGAGSLSGLIVRVGPDLRAR